MIKVGDKVKYIGSISEPRTVSIGTVGVVLTRDLLKTLSKDIIDGLDDTDKAIIAECMKDKWVCWVQAKNGPKFCTLETELELIADLKKEKNNKEIWDLMAQEEKE